MYAIIKKFKDAVHHEKTDTTGTAEGVAGPHSSPTANVAGPINDSDVDGRAAHHGGITTTGITGTTGGMADPRVDSAHHGLTEVTGTTGTGCTGTTGTTGDAGEVSTSTKAGTHNSDFAQEFDPLIDSDYTYCNCQYAANKTGCCGSHTR